MAEENNQTGNARTLTGRVASDKMDKTITVVVERSVRHPLYGKYVRRSTRFKVHDAENTARIGDTVRIAECRPISRDKHFRLVDVIERAPDLSTAS